MKVFAIDPGPVQSAYVVWDGYKILDKGKIPSADLLSKLRTTACSIVCEMVACYGMAVGAEVFETCVWIGRYLECSNGTMHRVKRLVVKMHLCHAANAKDANIRQALIDRLGTPGTKKEPGVTYGVAGDEWAALALAVTFYDQNQGVEP